MFSEKIPTQIEVGDQGILVKDLSRIFNGEVGKTVIFSLNCLIAVLLSESGVKVVQSKFVTF